MHYYRRLPQFEYVAPTTVGEAASLLDTHKGEARLLAGGTIVLHQMKERVLARPYVIGLKKVTGLNGITSGKDGLTIGSMALLQDIADGKEVRKKAPLLATVCGRLGTPQIRNMGTLGGNVAIRFATSETLPALIALNARAKLLSSKGERLVPMEDLYKEMKATDLLVAFSIPAALVRKGYQKFAVRERFDYATVACAVALTMDGKVCKDIRIGLGGVSLPTMRARKAEDLMKNQGITDALISKAAETAAEGGTTGSDLMFTADYKKKVLRVMVERALKEAAEVSR
jgi:aerobic carbon-monoxide dehydrogenase medium subunit